MRLKVGKTYRLNRDYPYMRNAPTIKKNTRVKLINIMKIDRKLIYFFLIHGQSEKIYQYVKDSIFMSILKYIPKED